MVWPMASCWENCVHAWKNVFEPCLSAGLDENICDVNVRMSTFFPSWVFIVFCICFLFVFMLYCWHVIVFTCIHSQIQLGHLNQIWLLVSIQVFINQKRFCDCMSFKQFCCCVLYLFLLCLHTYFTRALLHVHN